MPRIGYLDSLRGIAAVYVLMYHMALVPPAKPALPTWLYSIVHFGGSGVMLFFVLSAFSLCLTLGRHRSTGHTWMSYGVSRFFRIAPLFYVMMAFTYVRDILTFGVWQQPDMVLLSATFMLNFFPTYEQGYVWASWAIGVEMIFYVLFPLFFVTFRNKAQAIVLICLALLAGMAFNSVTAVLITDATVLASYQNFSIFRYILVFLIGMIAFQIHQSAAFSRHGPSNGAPLVALGFLVLGASAIIAGRAAAVPVLDIAHTIAVGYALILLGLAAAPNPFLDNAPLRFLGRISFSIYLLHAPIIFMLSPIYAHLNALSVSNTLRFMLSFAITLMATAPLAYATFRLIELPGIALGRQTIERLIARSTRTPTGAA